ncbi:hypothetical protein KSP40_PGU012867 [Platanthera guangdongensis]|uniref:Uncharacterized protein n=1 Tax=Platanthera guangdongensis TaxID=2320717 RepID=A0ABR2M208_9ASPA
MSDPVTARLKRTGGRSDWAARGSPNPGGPPSLSGTDEGGCPSQARRPALRTPAEGWAAKRPPSLDSRGWAAARLRGRGAVGLRRLRLAWLSLLLLGISSSFLALLNENAALRLRSSSRRPLLDCMEDDDEFGDLYTDVLRHNQAPSLLPAIQKPLAIPFSGTVAVTVDAGVEEDEILSRSSLLSASVPEPSSVDLERKFSADDDDDNDDDWLLGQDPPPVEEPVNWVDDDEDLIVDEASRDVLGGFPTKGGGPRVLDMKDVESASGVYKEEIYAIEGGGSVEKALEICDPEDEPVIPGLSAALSTSKVPNGGFVKASDSDDWDSGSEDDLQIVLNDTGHDMRGTEGGIGGGSDEDDEDLVIITDDQHHHHQIMEEVDWGDDGVQSSVDGEKKEMLEGAKASSVAPAASGASLGYSSHGFHPQHHSMFKYVRPGAAPAPRGPGMVSAGALGQARPPAFGPLAGRGRGDWRPAGGSGFPNMQKGFHSGYGLPAWGNGVAGRSFGGGLDFCLPSHNQRPSRPPLSSSHPESSCHCIKLVSKPKDYDPDLPPELAAATVHNNMSTENINLGKSENVLTGLTEQGGASASNRPTLPTGRAIQVESGYGERLPSIDTRAPRIRDSDAVIEIVLQDNPDDSRNSNGAFERPDNNLERENQNVFHEQDERPAESKYYHHFPRSSNIQQREAMAFRIPISSEEDGIMPLPSEVSCPASPKSRSPVDTAKSFGTQHGGRYMLYVVDVARDCRVYDWKCASKEELMAGEDAVR